MQHKVLVLFFVLISVISLKSCFLDNIDEEAEARSTNDSQIQNYITTNGLNAVGTGSGLYYAITEAKPTAQKTQKGDSVIFHYTARLLSGTIVDSTSTFRNRPDKRITDTQTILTGLEEGLLQMREGEKATILVPSYLGLGAAGSSRIPPFSVLIFEVNLIEVKSEQEMIDEFITRNNLTVTQVLDSNVLFIRLREGTPETKPKTGETYPVTYNGFLTNDTGFDKNLDSTFSVRIGANSVVFGFEAALKVMNQGDSALVIIPSKAGYGRSGSRNQATQTFSIPPYAPIIFGMALVKNDKQRIIEYIQANNLTDTVSTATGLYHRREITGSGSKPNDKSKVEVEYTATLLDGTVFGTSSKDTFNLETSNFENSFINSNNVALTISGLKEGIQLMQVGETRRFMLPSSLAFGGNSIGIVRRRTPVVFVVKLLKIL